MPLSEEIKRARLERDKIERKNPGGRPTRRNGGGPPLHSILGQGRAPTDNSQVIDTVLDDVVYKEIEWLWPYRVPLGMITMLCGRKGVMKGLIAMWLAAEVTRAGGGVLWCETEDPVAQVLKPRGIAAGADQKRFIVKGPAEYRLIGDLGQYIKEREIRLIVMSPLISFLKEVGDFNQEKQVRPELEKLKDVIEVHDCSLLALGHLNKRSGGDQTALERVMGTAKFVNFVRSVLIVALDKEEDCPRLMHAAVNLTSRDNDLLVELDNRNEEFKDKDLGGGVCSGSDRGPFVTVKLHATEDNVDADEALDRKSESKDNDDDGNENRQWVRAQLAGKKDGANWVELRDQWVSEGNKKESTLKTALRRMTTKGSLTKEDGRYRLAPAI